MRLRTLSGVYSNHLYQKYHRNSPKRAIAHEYKKTILEDFYHFCVKQLRDRSNIWRKEKSLDIEATYYNMAPTVVEGKSHSTVLTAHFCVKSIQSLYENNINHPHAAVNRIKKSVVHPFSTKYALLHERARLLRFSDEKRRYIFPPTTLIASNTDTRSWVILIPFTRSLETHREKDIKSQQR